MTDGQDENELINRSAALHDVPLDVLAALLALDQTLENFSGFGTKAEFSRQVARILDDASVRPGT